MHADLIELNNRIRCPNRSLREFHGLVLRVLFICVGRLNLSSAQLILLSATHSGRANAQDVICINRDYLQHARLVAQRIVSGVGYSGLLELGINMEQAHVLANLSNTQISQIAKYSDQEVFQRMAPACSPDPLALIRSPPVCCGTHRDLSREPYDSRSSHPRWRNG